MTKRPYLIQRARFKDLNNNDNGFDRFVRFDYMGSSEFEWGSPLFKSLQRIKTDEFDYIIVNLVKRDYHVTLLCKKDELETVSSFIESIYTNKARTKEYVGFREAIEHEKLKEERFHDLWWDIENDYMFWIREEPWNSELVKYFENLKNKEPFKWSLLNILKAIGTIWKPKTK